MVFKLLMTFSLWLANLRLIETKCAGWEAVRLSNIAGSCDMIEDIEGVRFRDGSNVGLVQGHRQARCNRNSIAGDLSEDQYKVHLITSLFVNLCSWWGADSFLVFLICLIAALIYGWRNGRSWSPGVGIRSTHRYWLQPWNCVTAGQFIVWYVRDRKVW